VVFAAGIRDEFLGKHHQSWGAVPIFPSRAFRFGHRHGLQLRRLRSSSDSTGGTLQVSIDVEAASSNKSASSGWPALTLATQQPFVHSHSVLIINGVARRIKDCSVSIDNKLLVDEFYNSRSRGDFPSDGQLITLTHSTPFDTADDVALTNLTAGVAGSLVYTNGTVSLTFTFPNLRYLAPEPEIGQRGSRVMNTYTWIAGLAPGGDPVVNPPLTCVLDDTI
jgi:Phage tail tube protein